MERKNDQNSCKSKRRHSPQQKKTLLKILFPLLGLGSLLWFFLRVIPKPSRASYPCMRIAAPMASSFVLWILGAGTSFLFFRKAFAQVKRSRRLTAAILVVAGALVGGILISSDSPISAASISQSTPIGEAKGINPGRVVWVHDSSVSKWQGVGNGHWWESSHTNQAVADKMFSLSLQKLTGKNSDSAAWDTLFRSFNIFHGRGNKKYSAGEKIAIKVNLVGGCRLPSWCPVDTNTLRLFAKLDYMNVSPQCMHALLGELVRVVGVAQSDISIGDPSAYFPGQLFDMLYPDFPGVHYIDCKGTLNRTKVEFSTEPMYWSCRPTGVNQDYIPRHYADAAYLINLAAMKSHSTAGITLCAKNHYGSLVRLPADSGYYSLHESLAAIIPQMGSYRALVDLMGHAHLGGKTVLFLVDGLYSGSHYSDSAPHKWNVAPFNGGWTSSIFASQDPVAIESVLYDLFQLDEDPTQYPKMAGVTDYLIEAAMANNPPSGTFYDPNHAVPTTRLQSLGVFEHWNNPVDRKYSRNLGTGNGIELVYINGVSSAVQRKPLSDGRNQGYALRELRGSGRLEFAVPKEEAVSLVLFDERGRKVRTLFEGKAGAGIHFVDVRGGTVPAGDGASNTWVAVLYRSSNGSIEPVASGTVISIR
jgi:hypothetical protein